jgi:O-methyltransferase
VYDWKNGSDFPDDDQVCELQKLCSPGARLKRALFGKIAPVFEKYFLLSSKSTLYPYQKDRGLITKYLATFRDEPEFSEAYSKGIDLLDYDPKSYYRIHQAIWAASVALENEGDWIELGTGRGFTMSATLKYHEKKWNKSSKNLWLVDTFSPYEINYDTGVQVESGKKIEFYCDDLQKLEDHFREFNNVHFLQGLIPDCLDRLNVEKISFLHIDLNAAKPEIEGLTLLWDRLVKGGILLLDDYGFPNRRDQHDAMNSFASSHSVEIFQLPTGQGLVIK